MALNEKLESIVMEIIANAGAARGAAFDALAETKNGNYKNSEELLTKATEYSHTAHVKHSELLSLYARGELEQSDLLISHAQDHLMCAELAKELILEIICLHKERKEVN